MGLRWWILLFAIVGTAVLIGSTKTYTIQPINGNSSQGLIQDNSFRAVACPLAIKSTTVGLINDLGANVINDQSYTIDSINRVISLTGENKDLIKCLIKYESSWNVNAVGDSGLAFGLLQFHEATFNFYKERYGLDWFEWKNPIHQIILANEMINDGLAFHWSVYKLCR